MNAIETAEMGVSAPTDESAGPADAAPSRQPAAAEIASWLLDGRYLTVDSAGAVTTWSSGAEETFGWGRRDMVGLSFSERVIAPGDRDRVHERLSALLGGDVEARLDGAATALGADGDEIAGARFVAVPIAVGAGYDFNSLLRDVAAGARATESRAALEQRHEAVTALIDDALAGRHAGRAETDEARRVAGALLVFELSAPMASADNVVPIAEALSTGEAHGRIEEARQIAEEAQAHARALEGQLGEARREAQRARNEADAARQEAADARDSLAAAQREAETRESALVNARAQVDDAGAAAEAARIRMEEALREAGRIRTEMLETREEARATVARLDAEVARAREDSERSARELAEARREVGRLGGELEAALARAEAAQAELVEARSAAGGARADGERTRVEMERLRAELAAAVESGDRAREEAERIAAELAAADGAPAVAELRARVEHLEAAFERAPVGAVVTTPEGRIVDVNRALCDTLGYTRAALLTDDPPQIVHPDDVDAKRELARRMLLGEQVAARGYRRYMHADGYAITMRESAALLRDPSGEPRMFLFQLEETPAGEQVDLLGEHLDHVVIDAELAPDGAAAHDDLTPDAIRAAVEEERFVLHCQPVLDLHSNQVRQHELLLRIVDDAGRVVLPQGFLEPARRAGLAGAIDRWVVRKAIALLAGDQDGERSVEINLSPEAIHDDELPEFIERELAATLVDPARLIVEITSQAAVEDLERSQALAKRLRAHGCRFALDDFRSTFGALRLLKDLPLDYLKLDGEIVGSLADNQTSQLIVKAIVDVARATGTRTVAVFVSEDRILHQLRQHGVDCAQGYAVGRPRPIDDLWASQQPALPSGD
jgi:PAS domain S-box-containing protein